jgi:Asp-tRNA(Asn)/Glu-tRNA(Gln) amidotransferase A subunit family amidase
MLNRRHALSVLGAMGIGTVTFRRALAAGVDGAATVTSEMVAEAEWVAGIELTSAQREAVAKSLNAARESAARLRAIQLDNFQLPGLAFVPLSTPNSQPDPRGYQIVKPRERMADEQSPPHADDELAFSSITRLGELLRGRKISSVELTKFYLDRLHRYDPLLKCVVTFTDDLALRQAERADREFKEKKDRGPLHGIPWGMKDVLAYPGYPTTWGAPHYRNRIIDVKSAVAERLEEAGAVLVAKLATNPFSGGGGLWYRGLTRNPWNPRQSASGSSSGPACATAAGLVGFSIATETAGSIQAPSARCGAVGLRPTYGRVSRFGCMQLCWSLDKIGPICRSADDCGLVLAAIHGADPRDAASVDRKYVWPSSRDISTIRVGYSAAKEGDDVKREDLQVIRELRAKLMPVRLPTLSDDYNLTHELIEGVVTIESATTFEDLTRRGEPKGVQGWPSYWAHGHFLSGVDYLKLNRMRAILMQRFDEMMQRIDIYVGDELALYDNLTGHPKIVFPRKFKEDGGLLVPRPQVMTGRVYDESTLLALADAYQQAIGLAQRPPLDQFLAEKDEILKDEKFPDENRLYID